MHAPLRRFAVPAALGMALATGLMAVTPPPAALAATDDTMESSLLSWINRDRTARGLRALVRDARLADLAGDRATILAIKGVLSLLSAWSAPLAVAVP